MRRPTRTLWRKSAQGAYPDRIRPLWFRTMCFSYYRDSAFVCKDAIDSQNLVFPFIRPLLEHGKAPFCARRGSAIPYARDNARGCNPCPARGGRLNTQHPFSYRHLAGGDTFSDRKPVIEPTSRYVVVKTYTFIFAFYPLLIGFHSRPRIEVRRLLPGWQASAPVSCTDVRADR
jgi:hypothetical protein